jgi:hypothetical protein
MGIDGVFIICYYNITFYLNIRRELILFLAWILRSFSHKGKNTWEV